MDLIVNGRDVNHKMKEKNECMKNSKTDKDA